LNKQTLERNFGGKSKATINAGVNSDISKGSVDIRTLNKDVHSTISYNPYNAKDYQKIKDKDKQEPARGLGSNKGDEVWTKA